MFNKVRYYANGHYWDYSIIIKTDEEMEMFKDYMETSFITMAVPYTLSEPDRNGWIKAYSDYDLDRLRSKYAQLRRKRGSFHKWTVDDISKSEAKLKRLLDDVDYNKIDSSSIKYVCHHIDELSNYIEDLIGKQRNEG